MYCTHCAPLFSRLRQYISICRIVSVFLLIFFVSVSQNMPTNTRTTLKQTTNCHSGNWTRVRPKWGGATNSQSFSLCRRALRRKATATKRLYDLATTVLPKTTVALVVVSCWCVFVRVPLKCCRCSWQWPPGWLAWRTGLLPVDCWGKMSFPITARLADQQKQTLYCTTTTNKWGYKNCVCVQQIKIHLSCLQFSNALPLLTHFW